MKIKKIDAATLFHNPKNIRRLGNAIHTALNMALSLFVDNQIHLINYNKANPKKKKGNTMEPWQISEVLEFIG